MNEAWEIVGKPAKGGILLVADHASNFVPEDIKIGLTRDLLSRHIAVDIGVAPVARLMAEEDGFGAILGGVSRLVVDLNRRAEEDAVIPASSDGIEIMANAVSTGQRAARLARFHYPYHAKVAELVSSLHPLLLISLHSFTPRLTSRPFEQRPWEVGVLYNRDDRAARIAIPLLEQAGLNVGDQLPYSGKELNATMDRHGEATGTAYTGIEMRQDLVADRAGQERFAAILVETCQKITERLGAAMQSQ